MSALLLAPAEITVDLPVDVVDRLRGTQPRKEWVSEAALRLARKQAGFDPLEPVDWAMIRRALRRCGLRRMPAAERPDG